MNYASTSALDAFKLFYEEMLPHIIKRGNKTRKKSKNKGCQKH